MKNTYIIFVYLLHSQITICFFLKTFSFFYNIYSIADFLLFCFSVTILFVLYCFYKLFNNFPEEVVLWTLWLLSLAVLTLLVGSSIFYISIDLLAESPIDSFEGFLITFKLPIYFLDPSRCSIEVGRLWWLFDLIFSLEIISLPRDLRFPSHSFFYFLVFSMGLYISITVFTF